MALRMIGSFASLARTSGRISGSEIARPFSTIHWKDAGNGNFTFPMSSVEVYNPPRTENPFPQPPSEITVSKDDLMTMYREMVLLRRMEVHADQLYKRRLIRGFLHLYDGQEAVVIGMEHAITKDDSIITSYRDHCQQVTRGDSPRNVFAELFGRSTGCSKGKGGSMHMYRRSANFFGGNGIVGAQCPLGAGLAFAQKYLKQKNLTVCSLGDGAANQGQLYEAINLAALWKLPLIYVVENNRYGMGTSIDRSAADTHYHERGHFIPGLKVNGQDVLEVRNAFSAAAEWVRNGNGPLMINAITYRFHGHSMSDPGLSYRSREEVRQMRETRDPLMLLRNYIVECGASSAEELQKIEKEIRADIEAQADLAEKDPFPSADELLTDVYAEANVPIRGSESVTWHQSP